MQEEIKEISGSRLSYEIILF